MTPPTERAPTLEQVQRDRELIANSIRDYCADEYHAFAVASAVQRVQDKLAPLPPKYVTFTGWHRRRLPSGKWQVCRVGDHVWTDVQDCDDDIRALASLLPENATTAAQPAPTPRTFTLEEILDKAPRIFDELNFTEWYLRREMRLWPHGMGPGGATDAIRHAITRALTAEQGGT